MKSESEALLTQPVPPPDSAPLFQSMVLGGIECSTHRLGSGKRLDVIAATQHDRYAEQDYLALKAHGITTIRSGFRWPLHEPSPRQYDFTHVLPQIHAARTHGIQVIWDLCHYGWPDDEIDIFTPAFIRRFAAYAREAARVLVNESDAIPFICPVNEISFFAWGGGDVRYLNPFWDGRGHELKVQLVRATIESIEAIWEVAPHARIVHVDPVINVITDPNRPHDHPWAEGHRQAQFQAWDMLCGHAWPQAGGDPRYLDIIGVNFYSNNQWIHGGPTIYRDHPLYKPFRNILTETYERYQRPIFVGETGAEDDARGGWFRYVAGETVAAIKMGVPVEGVCLYPILNHPGWDNDRHCHNGLLDYADANGQREVHQPLANEIKRALPLLTRARTALQNENASRRLQAARSVEVGKRPRVCLFTDSLEASGMGEHMAVLAEHLRHRCDLTFIMPSSEANLPYLQRAKTLNLRVERLRVRGENRESFEQLRDLLRAGRYDIFHSHAGVGWEGHDGIYAALFGNTPVRVRTEHLPYALTEPRQKAGYMQTLGRLNHLIAVSHASRDTYLRAGVPDAQITAIQNGITPRIAQKPRAEVRRRLRIPDAAPLLLTVARFTDQKGYHYLADAIPAVLEQHPNAHFAWVGDGPLKEEMRARVQVLGVSLARQVHFLGWREDVADLLGASDLFVLPSLFEGLPLIVLEALANDCPVVATNVGGVPEIITDGEHGRLVAPGSPAALVEGITEVMANPAQAKIWANDGKQRVKTSFTAEAMADATFALYTRLLNDLAASLPAEPALEWIGTGTTTATISTEKPLLPAHRNGASPGTSATTSHGTRTHLKD